MHVLTGLKKEHKSCSSMELRPQPYVYSFPWHENTPSSGATFLHTLPGVISSQMFWLISSLSLYLAQVCPSPAGDPQGLYVRLKTIFTPGITYSSISMSYLSLQHLLPFWHVIFYLFVYSVIIVDRNLYEFTDFLSLFVELLHSLCLQHCLAHSEQWVNIC